MESLLNANEIAEILGVSRATVFVLWSRNELPAVRIGKSIRCRPGDLADFIDANTIGANKNLPIAGTKGKLLTSVVPTVKEGKHHER